jgi:CheY-like chemotaxis protein/HPt (histidine-containing phosphotransfer) domain-containing protein
MISKSAADSGEATSGESQLRKELVLIAEDHPINQEVATLYMSELGFMSHMVSNGKEALEALSRKQYSLVLMDCQMPVLDGFATTKAIRKNEALTGYHIPIIAVTANAMKGDREKCVAAGMDDHISKPIDPEELKRIVELWLPASQQGASFLPVEAHEGVVSTSTPIDIPRLRNRFDSKAAQMLVGMFITSTPETLDKIGTAIVEGDCDKVAALGHYLKGACGTIYATKIKELCSQLEKKAEQGDMSSARTIHEQFQTAFHELKEYIDTHLPAEDVAAENDRQDH